MAETLGGGARVWEGDGEGDWGAGGCDWWVGGWEFGVRLEVS